MRRRHFGGWESVGSETPGGTASLSKRRTILLRSVTSPARHRGSCMGATAANNKTAKRTMRKGIKSFEPFEAAEVALDPETMTQVFQVLH